MRRLKFACQSVVEAVPLLAVCAAFLLVGRRRRNRL
jgi:hypothetical protein